MSMGRRKTEQQRPLFLLADDLPKSAGPPFYVQLNRLLAAAGFDAWIEARCQPDYAAPGTPGRPSIPPGVYFRMLLVGYFEDIDSQRGIAWRCADSLSLREFVGTPLDQDSPDHTTLSATRQRLPAEVFSEVFEFVLSIAVNEQLVDGRTVGVDSTTLEANAAMKSIVRRDSGEDWNAYLRRLMQESGEIAAEETPSDEDLRRFDKGRKDKKVSNEEWVSQTDADAQITKMKDGTTHLAYKAEHVVDLASNLIVAAEIYGGAQADMHTLPQSVAEARRHLEQAGGEQDLEEVVADKGYHSAECLEFCERLGLRTYIPERKSKHPSKWTDKRESQRRAVLNNRRRVRRKKSRRYQRLRSERCERSFAHVCDTGGSRRSWLRSFEDVSKRYLIAAAAHNLGRFLRVLFGGGKPRECADGAAAAARNLTQLTLRTISRALRHLRTPPATVTLQFLPVWAAV